MSRTDHARRQKHWRSSGPRTRDGYHCRMCMAEARYVAKQRRAKILRDQAQEDWQGQCQ